MPIAANVVVIAIILSLLTSSIQSSDFSAPHQSFSVPSQSENGNEMFASVISSSDSYKIDNADYVSPHISDQFEIVGDGNEVISVDPIQQRKVALRFQSLLNLCLNSLMEILLTYMSISSFRQFLC